MLIWTDAIGRHGAELLLVIAFMAQAYCGMASVTANSRMLYAFSRDGAVPGHSYWHRINPRTRTPTNSIWFCVVFAFLLAVPSLWSGVAYGAVTSIATIGLYIAYVLPTLLRRLQGAEFGGGPLEPRPVEPARRLGRRRLGGLHRHPLHAPRVSARSTGTRSTTPPSPSASCSCTRASTGSSRARKWFTGPKVQGSEDELKAIEASLSARKSHLEGVD